MVAADVMRKDIVSIGPETSIMVALALMKEHDIRHLLVLDGDDLAGVLSNRDYRRVLYRANADGSVSDVHGIVVKDIMTPVEVVIVAHPDTPLMNIAQLMVVKKVGCIPVMNGDRRPIGLVTQKDVMEQLTRPRLPEELKTRRARRS
jgi:acetoin utilization protein AcuB